MSAIPTQRVAIFISFSGQGGVEHMVGKLAGGFLEAGLSVDLVLARAEGEHLATVPDGVRIVKLNVRHTTQALPGLIRYLKENQPDALLAAKERAIRIAILARWLSGCKMRLAGRLGTTVSAALKDKSALRRWTWFTGMRLFHPRMDTVIAVSQGVKDDIMAITGQPDSHIRVIPNPVITPELYRKAAEPFRHPWLDKPDIPVIMGMGRLTRQKGFPDLIRAFARLRQQQAARLIIIGEGKDRDTLQALAEELGVAADVDLVGFMQNPYPLVAKASLFVLSSLWEGSPNVLTEALALGRPVVATDCPSGPREILEGGKFGPLVAMGDIEALASAMRATLAHPLNAATLQSAVTEYTVERSSRRYLEALELTSS